MIFFIVISGRINCGTLVTKKRFLVVQTYSMCQVASVCRGSAWIEDLERLPVDWGREKVFHLKSITLLEILLNHSWNSSVHAFPAFVK